jgi:hypothetical protein
LSIIVAAAIDLIDTHCLPDVHLVTAGSSLAGAGVAVVRRAAPTIGIGLSFDELVFVSFSLVVSIQNDEP